MTTAVMLTTPLQTKEMTHEPPTYVRSLTNSYKLRYRYWECFECIRKVR